MDPTRRVPLGTIVGARSGDKGGDANLGVWVRDPARLPVARRRADRRPAARAAAGGQGPRHRAAPAAQPERGQLRAARPARPGRRRVHPLRPAGQVARRVAAVPARRHPGGPAVSDPFRTPRAHGAARDDPAVRRDGGPAAPRRVGAGRRAAARRCTARPARSACSASAFPEEVGGGGGDVIDAMTVTEEIHYAGGSGGLVAALFTSGIALPHIVARGRPGPDRPLGAADARRRADRLARGHRAGRRLGRGERAHHGQARRRPLHRQRRQDVHHLRLSAPTSSPPSCAPATRARTACRCWSSSEAPRLHGHPQARQDGLALLGHRRVVLCGRPGAGGEPGRRGGQRVRAGRHPLRQRAARARRAGLRHRAARRWT